jgi:hypothetical protein
MAGKKVASHLVIGRCFYDLRNVPVESLLPLGQVEFWRALEELAAELWQTEAPRISAKLRRSAGMPFTAAPEPAYAQGAISEQGIPPGDGPFKYDAVWTRRALFLADRKSGPEELGPLDRLLVWTGSEAQAAQIVAYLNTLCDGGSADARHVLDGFPMHKWNVRFGAFPLEQFGINDRLLLESDLKSALAGEIACDLGRFHRVVAIEANRAAEHLTAKQPAAGAKVDADRQQSEAEAQPGDTESPIWQSASRKLGFRDETISFKANATNAICVLSEFQRDGWPCEIDDPIPPSGDVDPKDRLRETAKYLRRKTGAMGLEFRPNGNGTGITWASL